MSYQPRSPDYYRAQRLVTKDKAIPVDLQARLAVEGIDADTIQPAPSVEDMWDLAMSFRK